MNKLFLACLCGAGIIAGAQNLLLNPSFEFHSFVNHREGKAISYSSGSVAFWNENAYNDVTVLRESHADANARPQYSVGNIVTVAPGKKLWQTIPLPEARLAHGDKAILQVAGWQNRPGAAKATLQLLKLDSEDGTWKPSDFGMGDSRTFPRHSRGELVVASEVQLTADDNGFFDLRLPALLINGHFTPGRDSHSADCNAVALRVVLENTTPDARVSFWAPVLTKAEKALFRQHSGGRLPVKIFGIVPSERAMEPVFRHIPKTMQKLWRGESLHIILMGSSIDRGSANPPMYLFNEDPKSPDFKKPIAGGNFDASKINRPDLDGYYGWWQHYFSYGGRLRLELMRKFNLPVQKICLNMMACDGSCIGEATSCLETYCTLSQAPSESANGHKSGTKWQELYPELFTRPQGPGPDLVIFGSGANEKTDTPDEGAIFEASIRWIQQRYPDTEFLFCVFQNRGGYTPNPGDLQAIALRYQIPFLDYGKLGDDLCRWCNPFAFVPVDGHPQAAGHDFWAQCLSRAFECWDPIPAGEAQLHLPARLYRNTIGWEGALHTYKAGDPRIKGNMLLLDDTTVNFWGSTTQKDNLRVAIDGALRPGNVRIGSSSRDIRNSMFRYGNLSLGDRHIVELVGENAKINAADMKTANNRLFIPVSSPLWQHVTAIGNFHSEWGAPYGNAVTRLAAGKSIEILVPGNEFSIAYADAKDGGKLLAAIDGKDKLQIATNQPFLAQDKKAYYMENRRAINGLAYGMHRITIKAQDGPVQILGIFSYDTRPNRQAERCLNGIASPNETIHFVPPFKATPIIRAFNGLRLKSATPESATFTGEIGQFEAIGE